MYVVVKTADGDYLTEVMSADEVNEIRNRIGALRAHRAPRSFIHCASPHLCCAFQMIDAVAGEARFCKCGNVGQRRRPGCCRNGEHAQSTACRVRTHAEVGGEADLHVVGKQRHDDVGGTLVRDVSDVRTAQVLEHLTCHMFEATGTG